MKVQLNTRVEPVTKDRVAILMKLTHRHQGEMIDYLVEKEIQSLGLEQNSTTSPEMGIISPNLSE